MRLWARLASSAAGIRCVWVMHAEQQSIQNYLLKANLELNLISLAKAKAKAQSVSLCSQLITYSSCFYCDLHLLIQSVEAVTMHSSVIWPTLSHIIAITIGIWVEGAFITCWHFFCLSRRASALGRLSETQNSFVSGSGHQSLCAIMMTKHDKSNCCCRH